MKPFKLIIIVVFCLSLLLATSSCVVVRKDNGKHRGWFKNRDKPNHPKAKNPGKSNDAKEGASKGKMDKLNIQAVTNENFYQWQVIKPF